PYTVPQRQLQQPVIQSRTEENRVTTISMNLTQLKRSTMRSTVLRHAHRENFDDFLSRMSAFMSRFPGLGEHGKIATLIAYLGPAFATYAAWFDQQCVLHGLPVGSNLEHLPGARYDSLLQFLRARHGGAKSTALLRLELRSRCRGKDETFEQFLTALQRLAVKAFPDAGAHEFLQQAVLDQFIQGLNNSYVTERLLNMPMPVTTTEQALRWAQQIRETQQFLEGQGQNQQHQRGTATSAPVVGSAALPMHGQRPGLKLAIIRRNDQCQCVTAVICQVTFEGTAQTPGGLVHRASTGPLGTEQIGPALTPQLPARSSAFRHRAHLQTSSALLDRHRCRSFLYQSQHRAINQAAVQTQQNYHLWREWQSGERAGKTAQFISVRDVSFSMALEQQCRCGSRSRQRSPSKLVAAAAVQLQPGEGWTVPVRPLHVTAWTSSEAPGIVNGSRSSKVLIARCVAKISNNGMGVAIINASDAPVAVREGDTIGWFTPLSSQGGTQLQSTSMATATTSIDGNAPWLREVHIADEISAMQTASTPCQVEAGGTKLALVNVATTDPAPSAADPQNDPRTAGRAPSRRKQQLQPRPSESEEFSDSDDQDDDGDDETGQARAMQSNESLTLRERQLKDADIGPVFRLLAKGKTRLSDQQRARLPPGSLILAQKIKELCFVDGALHRLVESKQLLIDEIHEVGHLGEAKTLAGLKSRCYWPKMSESIRVAVRACQVCQRAKTSGHQRAPLRSIVSSFPMQRIGIDVVKIGVSRHGNDRLLTIMDYFTKWVELVPMPDEKAATIARALFDNWVSRSVNATSGFTPHFLMTGREVTLPLDIVYRLPEPPRTTGQFAADNRDRLLSAFESVRLATAAAQRRQRRYYDQKAARRRFRAGDLVWLFVPPSALSRTSGLPPKHQAPWTGPFRVLRRTSPVNYLVRPVEYKDGDAGRVVHVNKLKRAHQPRPPDQPRSGAASDDSSEVLDADWVLRRRLASPQSSTARSLVECTTECQTAASCEIPPKSEALPSTEVNGDLGNSVAKWSLSAAKWIATIANIENLTHAATSLSWLECTRDEQAKAFGETGRANPLLLGNRSSATAAIGKASGQVGHEKRSQTSHCTMGQLSLIKYSLGWPLQPQPLRCHAGCTEAKAADSALMHGYLPDAASHGHLELVKFLVPTVADQKQRDYCCIKAAESAAVKGHIEIVKFLVPTVADQTKRDDCCIKAAEYAAVKGHIEIVKFLVPTVAAQTIRDDCCIKAAGSAGRYGHIEIVKFLVPTVADQTKRDDCCIKAAGSAGRYGHIEIVKFLVPTVADQTKRDDCCIKAAEYAAVKGHIEIVKFLVPTVADQTIRDDCCIKAAGSAGRYGHIEIVKFLVPTVADQTKRDDCCIKAAEYAAIKGHIEIVKFLVPTVADQTKRDDCCIKAAESAAVKGHIEIVKFLVPTVADQTKRDDCCIKAAEYAAVKGHIEIVKFLVPTVADQTIRDDCCIKAAGSAGRYGHIEIVKFLVPTVADQTKRDDCCIKAAGSAGRYGHIEIVKFLVPTVADQTKRDDCCIKAAGSAGRYGHIEIVKFLVPTVADQTKRDDCRIKAAESAYSNGHFEIVKFLVPTVADQTKRDDCCIKAAASAAFNGHIEIVKFLVPTVADQTKRDDCRIKAAESAGRNGHFEIVKFLVPTVADQTKRDDCCIKAAKSAADEGHIEIVKFLVPTVADQTKRDDCRIKAAESAGRNGHFEIVKFLVLTVADQTKRDDCCIKAAESAYSNGHFEIVKFLVPTVANQTKRDDCCIKAAGSAGRYGHIEIVKFLVPTVADQTKRDDCRIKAAEYAAVKGHIEIVKFLVPTFLVPTVADQTKRDDCCIKAAKSAADEGHIEIVKFLVPTVADQTKRDDCRIKAAESAGRNGHFEIVKFLVLTVADQTKRDDCCIKAAESAYSNGHFEIVKFLVPTVADQTKRDDCCIKAAESAAIKGHMEIVKFLVPTVADQTKRDDCCIKAAASAGRYGHMEIVKFLVPTVADQTKRDDWCIKAAESAASNGLQDVVEFLISFLSSPDQRANLRFQCAVATCSRLHEDVAAFLGLEPDWLFQSSTILSFTAAMAIEGRNSVLTDTLSRMQPPHITQLLRLSISQRHVALAVTIAVTLINDERVSTQHVDLPEDSTGATALMLAADAGHHELIEKLIDLGASVRAEDSQGRTALSRACEAGHVRAAKALMDRGADASHRDGRGQTCAQVAQRFEQQQVLRLLHPSEAGSPEARQAAAHRLESGRHRLSDDSQQDRRLSEELHRLLSEAGFTEERAKCQQRLADWLEEVAQVLTQDDRQMTGSYAEGWANSLVQVNGRTAADSDIDWTVLVAGQEFHLEGGCDREGYRSCRDATRLQVMEGHAQVAVGAGSQPAVTATACGVRPAQDTCHAIECCSSFCEDRSRKPVLFNNRVHLVRATRPSSTNELRVSFSFQEKYIMGRLSTVQGQLFTLIKFIFKRHLPLTLDTPGLKTYHAKTLLFTMLEKHGTDTETDAWKLHNLIALLKESLDLMLSFIDSSSSPDECMPHFFMPDAPLYFKNAGIGGDFDNTKARVRDGLFELRSDIGGVVEQLRRLVRPLQSEKFYFHPFTLLPLTAPPAVTEIREGSGYTEMYYNFADVYSVVHQCVSELQSESSKRYTLMRQLSLLHELQWCKCAALCMTAMAHLKFRESEEAERLAMELQRHQVQSGLKPQGIRIYELPADSDWAWRFCLPCDSPPRFPFLPEFTQTLFTARLSQPLSSHLYVNFRCLSWSLQAELLCNRAPAIKLDDWKRELEEDPDLEELLTLAHYSDCREHVELSLQQMEMIEKERRVVMETQDEEKIGWVRQKRWRVSNRSGSDSGAHRSREDEERRLWARARLRRDGVDLGRFVAMETAAEQRDSWTHRSRERRRCAAAVFLRNCISALTPVRKKHREGQKPPLPLPDSKLSMQLGRRRRDSNSGPQQQQNSCGRAWAGAADDILLPSWQWEKPRTGAAGFETPSRVSNKAVHRATGGWLSEERQSAAQHRPAQPKPAAAQPASNAAAATSSVAAAAALPAACICSEKWRKWINGFKLFLTATKREKEADEVKTAILLTALGEQGRDIYDTLDLTEGNSFDQIVAAFEKFCKPLDCETFERYKFRMRTQQQFEEFDHYLGELRTLIKQCNFAKPMASETIENAILRDQIVYGVHNPSVRERLLEQDKLTLEKAIALCRASPGKVLAQAVGAHVGTEAADEDFRFFDFRRRLVARIARRQRRLPAATGSSAEYQKL
uniref:ANK_REP_REGION domain-containing protein n=1 Tax=Macrostomum lignano TaxID=282301 RepID=A0A1I8J1D1_9PLAT